MLIVEFNEIAILLNLFPNLLSLEFICINLKLY